METNDSLLITNTCLQKTPRFQGNEENINDVPAKEEERFLHLTDRGDNKCLAVVGTEAFLNWTSPALPYLKSKISEISVTDTQGVRIASIYNIGAIAGIPLYPYLFSCAGRKKMVLLLSVFQIICWVMIIFSQNIETLYIARFLGGLTSPACSKLVVTYICEIAEKDIRGSLIVIYRMFTRLGNLYIQTGALLPYRNMNILMLCTPVLFFSTFIFMPESPYFLLNRHQQTAARKNLSRLRRTKEPEILEPIIEEMRGAKIKDREQNIYAFRKLFCVRGNRRALSIVLLASATPILSGKPAISSYNQEIFGFTDLSLQPKYSAITLAAFDVCVKLFALLLVHRIRRRILDLLSGTISAIGLATLAYFFFMKLFLCIEMASHSWMVVLGLTLFTAGLEFGLFTVSDLMSSELLPLDIKGTGMLCVTLAVQVFSLLVRSSFHLINSVAGIYTTFLIYASFCFFGSLTFFYVAPETKDKSLEEIQDILHRKKEITEA